MTVNELIKKCQDMIEQLSKEASGEGKKYVICRTYSAGVFAGELESRNGKAKTSIKSVAIWAQ